MTRRSFLSNLALGVAAFSILPAAATYKRRWVKKEIWQVNPEWVAAPLEMYGWKRSEFCHGRAVCQRVATGKIPDLVPASYPYEQVADELGYPIRFKLSDDGCGFPISVEPLIRV